MNCRLIPGKGGQRRLSPNGAGVSLLTFYGMLRVRKELKKRGRNKEFKERGKVTAICAVFSHCKDVPRTWTGEMAGEAYRRKKTLSQGRKKRH